MSLIELLGIGYMNETGKQIFLLAIVAFVYHLLLLWPIMLIINFFGKSNEIDIKQKAQGIVGFISWIGVFVLSIDWNNLFN